VDSRLDKVEESLESVRLSQMKVELEQFPRISAALESTKGTQQKFNKLDRLENTVEDHGTRIFALEHAAKVRTK